MRLLLNDEQLTTLRDILSISGDHGRDLLREVDAQAAEQAGPLCSAYRRVAQERHDKDGEIEFDDDAVISVSQDDGAYVMAWYWIPAEDLPEGLRHGAYGSVAGTVTEDKFGGNHA